YFLLIPGILKAIREERNFLKRLVKTHQLQGVISDNRLGLYNAEIPSVIITHQLKVFSGLTTCLSTWLHRRYIAKYDYCWVPDIDAEQSLAGKLSKSTFLNPKIRYIGPLSRLKKRFPSEVKYAYLVLLSGPEPQRSMLEDILMAELLRIDTDQKVLFVRGVIEETQKFHKIKNIKVYNYLNSEGLEKAMSQSKVVISRSGYTTIMDLSKLGKKAFFIPTPGQYEQEYLADFLTKTGRVPSCSQDKFTLERLSQLKDYSGLDDTVFSASEFAAFFTEAFSNVKENSEPLPSSLST
ncbi:MAG: glycosyltransferase, partial [Flavobacteriaceae bacterium]|nr:glycosyltransferase [Flavobacteriaceae bacterium]